MKKMLWMAALTSVALAGCVNEEVAVDNPSKQQKELKFGEPMMYTQSRSFDGEIYDSEKKASYPENELFVVFAIETDGNFKGWAADNVQANEDDANVKSFFPINGVKVKKKTNDSYWHIEGEDKYFWPSEEGHKLTFAAYSPARAKNAGTITYGETGLLIKDFTIQSTPETQYDLMYSTRTIDATTSPVDINFKHALSSIRFTFVKPEVENGGANSITITKLSVSGGILDIGTFSQDIAASSPSEAGTPVWKDKKHVMEEGGSTPKDIEYVLFQGEFSVPTTGSEISNIYSFLPIPQNITDDMIVNVTYKVQQQAGENFSDAITNTIPFKNFLLSNSTEYTKEWVMGNRYVYHIHFGALKEIFFNPVISNDWTTTNVAGIYEISTTNNATP